MANNAIVELYGIIKNAQGKAQSTFIIGKIISLNPLLVDVGRYRIENCIVNRDVTFRTGDTVLLIPSADFQQFVMICRTENSAESDFTAENDTLAALNVQLENRLEGGQ